MDIHKRITEARHKLGLNQIQFAQGIHISNSYLASIELGNRRVNDRIIKLIVITYGINERWLREGEGTILDETPAWKLEQLSSIFKKLTPAFQDYAIKQLVGILDFQTQHDVLS